MQPVDADPSVLRARLVAMGARKYPQQYFYGVPYAAYLENVAEALQVTREGGKPPVPGEVDDHWQAVAGALRKLVCFDCDNLRRAPLSPEAQEALAAQVDQAAQAVVATIRGCPKLVYVDAIRTCLLWDLMSGLRTALWRGSAFAVRIARIAVRALHPLLGQHRRYGRSWAEEASMRSHRWCGADADAPPWWDDEDPALVATDVQTLCSLLLGLE